MTRKQHTLEYPWVRLHEPRQILNLIRPSKVELRYKTTNYWSIYLYWIFFLKKKTKRDEYKDRRRNTQITLGEREPSYDIWIPLARSGLPVYISWPWRQWQLELKTFNLENKRHIIPSDYSMILMILGFGSYIRFHEATIISPNFKNLLAKKSRKFWILIQLKPTLLSINCWSFTFKKEVCSW